MQEKRKLESSDDSEDIPIKVPFVFHRQKPVESIVEYDDDEDEFHRQLRLEAHEPSSNESNKVRKDDDGTEYEWDANVKGWFPKLSESYLIEHHMNYGLDDGSGFRFDKDRNCFVYEKDSVQLKLDPDSNKWIPLEAEIIFSSDGKTKAFRDPHTDVVYYYMLPAGQWIPGVSSYTDRNTAITYIWISSQNAFVDSRTIEEYTDHISGIKYQWSDEEVSWKIITEKVEEEPKVENSSDTTIKQKNTTENAWFDIPDEKNTSVYVSGLPLDITENEFEDLMSKYGIIATESSSGKLKTKLYYDSDGKVKGDGLCTYLKIESVELCLKLLDEMVIRDSKLHVERASFQMKGNFNPDLKKKKKKSDKKKDEKRGEKLLGWDEEIGTQTRDKHERIVVLKNFYDAKSLCNDMSMFDKIVADIKKMFGEYETVKAVRLYPKNEENVATVALLDPTAADNCIRYINGRIYGNRLLTCHTWDGKTKYDSVSTVPDNDRIENWHRYLEEE